MKTHLTKRLQSCFIWRPASLHRVCGNFGPQLRFKWTREPSVHCSLAVIYRVFWRQSNWEKSDYVRSTQRIILLGQISSGCSVIRNRLHFKRSLYHRAGGCVLEIGNRFGNGSHGVARAGGRGEGVTEIGCDCAQLSCPPPQPGVCVCPGRCECPGRTPWEEERGCERRGSVLKRVGGKKAAMAIKRLLS